MDEGFLTTEEVLEYLQVNLRTVYRLIKAGKIPAVRVGRQWRFRKRDIDAWLDSQRSRSTQANMGAPTIDAKNGRHRVLVVDDEAGILDTLEPLFAAYARERQPGEGFGDFTVRAGHVAPPPAVPAPRA